MQISISWEDAHFTGIPVLEKVSLSPRHEAKKPFSIALPQWLLRHLIVFQLHNKMAQLYWEGFRASSLNFPWSGGKVGVRGRSNSVLTQSTVVLVLRYVGPVHMFSVCKERSWKYFASIWHLHYESNTPEKYTRISPLQLQSGMWELQGGQEYTVLVLDWGSDSTLTGPSATTE